MCLLNFGVHFCENALEIVVVWQKIGYKNDKMSKNVYFCWVITFCELSKK